MRFTRCLLHCDGDKLPCDMRLSLIFLNTIAVMGIPGESENIPSWVADWPHCCAFGGDTCDGLRWSAMVLEASKSQQNAPLYRIVWPGLYTAEIGTKCKRIHPWTGTA